MKINMKFGAVRMPEPGCTDVKQYQYVIKRQRIESSRWDLLQILPIFFIMYALAEMIIPEDTAYVMLLLSVLILADALISFYQASPVGIAAVTRYFDELKNCSSEAQRCAFDYLLARRTKVVTRLDMQALKNMQMDATHE